MLRHYQRRDTVTQQLFSRLRDRVEVSTLEQRNVVPRGYFLDAVCLFHFNSLCCVMNNI